MNLNDVNRSGTLTLSKGGLAAGTTTTYSTTAAVLSCIKGKLYSKSAVTNGTTPTVDVVTGKAFQALTAGKSCIFLFGFDSGGTIRVTQGPIVPTDDVNGDLAALHYPTFPDTIAAFGALIAKAGSTLVGTWTFGTNNLSGVTGMTYTFADLAFVPAAPEA